MAGNGTIGLEIAEDAPEFDAVVIPWGGGGLTSGIASALKALRPGVRVVTAEPETGAPLAAAFAAGEPREIEFEASWVDGAGGRVLLPGVWERARDLVDEAVALPLAEVEEAVDVCWPPARTSSLRELEPSRSRPRYGGTTAAFAS